MKTKNYLKKAILLFLVCCAQFIMAQVPSYVPTNGLVCYYPFTGNANDVSGNSYNGTTSNVTLTTDRFGNPNSAYNFVGTAGSVITASPILPIGNASRTISAWVKSTSATGGGSGTNLNVMVNWGLGQSGKMCELFFDLGKAKFQNYAANVLNSNTNINDNIWHNVIGTYDNVTSTLKIYIDGVLKGTLSGTFNTTNSQLYIGERASEITLQKMDGTLDDIGIWNRALSHQEVTNIYNQVAPYSDTCNAVSGSLTQGLVGYWPFCGNANDDSGNGNNGTVNGATLTTDRFGNSNSAYSFNGTSNFIEVPDNNLLDISNNYTLSAWFKITDYSTSTPSDPFCTILGKGRQLGWASGYALYAVNGNNSNRYGSHQWGMSGMPNESSIPAPLNVWNQIICTYDGTNLKLYFNGVLIRSQSVTYILGNYITSLYFGKEFDNSSVDWKRFFKGSIDDIGIWNRALTTQEVTQLFNQNQCFTNTTVTDTLVINLGQLSYTNPISYANNITIFPNPASTQVNIAFNNISDLNGGSIKIINSLGQQVATTPITTSGTNTTMTLSTWGGTGLYFVQIVNPQGQIVDIKKILLQ
jgi:hypothetical protein